MIKNLAFVRRAQCVDSNIEEEVKVIKLYDGKAVTAKNSYLLGVIELTPCDGIKLKRELLEL